MPEPFDGGNAVAFVHDREREAGIDAASVDDHRAGATLSVVATFFGAGEMQMVTQRIEQRGARVELQRARFAVHVERELRDGGCCGSGSLRIDRTGQCTRGRGGRAGDQHLAAIDVFGIFHGLASWLAVVGLVWIWRMITATRDLAVSAFAHVFFRRA